MFGTTQKMKDGTDYRDRLTLVFIPSGGFNYHEVFCTKCSSKLLETNNDIAYISDVTDTLTLKEGEPDYFGMKCPGHCRTFYHIKSETGMFKVEVTKMFFIGHKKYREVHCHRCKQILCTITSGSVHSPVSPFSQLRSDENGFVPTFCVNIKCGKEYDIAT